MTGKLYRIFFIFFLLIHFNVIGQNEIIIDYKINQDNSVNFNYKKTSYQSQLLKIKFTSLYNTSSQSTFTKTIKNKSGFLMKLKPVNSEESIGFQYSYSFFNGNINSKIDRDFQYVFPFIKDEIIRPIELYNIDNKYLNDDLPKDWKSYSFSFDTSKDVMSIRRGTVIEIIDIHTPNLNFEYDYYSNQNSIKIEHRDGSVAVYKGFDKNRINVSVGDEVYPQTKIGELSQFDKRNIYRLYLSLICFKTVGGKNINKIQGLEDYEMVYLTPKFFNSKSSIISSGINYKVEYNENILFKELKKREIKKFKSLKNKN